MVPTVPGLVSEMVVSGEIGGGQLAFARAIHEIVEGGDILREIQRAGILDVGHQQIAVAVFARHIHGDAQIDLRMHDARGLAVQFAIGMIQAGVIFEGLQDGPADQVRVGDLAFAYAGCGAG